MHFAARITYIYCWHFVVYSSISLLSFFCPNSFALRGLITLLPSFFSKSFRAIPATEPPFFAILLFSLNVFGVYSLDNSVVDVSANIFNTNSRFVILSRRFSFFKSLKNLYSLVVKPAQAFVISSVRIEYSKPFLTP